MTDLDSAPCLYFCFADDGRILQANAPLCTLLGYAPREPEGKQVEELFTLATRIFFQTHFFPLLRIQQHAEEIFLTLRSKAGSDIPVLVQAQRSEAGGVWTNACAAVTLFHRKQYEDELVAAKRQAERALADNSYLKEAREELTRQAEQLDDRIRELELRNAELKQISRVVSHDLEEPIRKLQFFADLLNGEQNQHALPEPVVRKVGKLQAFSLQIKVTVGALQQFVWLNDRIEEKGPVDLTALLRLAHHEVEAATGQPIELALSALPPVIGMSKQLQLLFHQLLKNAVQYRKPDRPVRVQVSGVVVQENTFRALAGRYHYADFLKIDVRDEGQGFDPSFSDRIFDLFRKLHPGEGRGLGLALCKKVVDNHRGMIRAEGVVDGGACFTIYLPLRD